MNSESCVVRSTAQSNPSEPTGPELQEVEFKRRLVEAGLLNEVRPPVPDPESYHGRTPVPVTGMPLSETIVEEPHQCRCAEGSNARN